LGAIEQLPAPSVQSGAFNLGTGRGYSVLDLVQAFERASGQAVPYRIALRRPGDVGLSYADSLQGGKRAWLARWPNHDRRPTYHDLS
jgi:UDP-glucose 4-epimerase